MHYAYYARMEKLRQGAGGPAGALIPHFASAWIWQLNILWPAKIISGPYAGLLGSSANSPLRK